MSTPNRLMIPEIPTDLPREPRFLEHLPGLAFAFDPEKMAPFLQEAVIKDGWQVESCEAGKGLYLPDGFVCLQYNLQLRGPGGIRPHLINARVFPSAGLACDYYEERLEPLAVKTAGRLELEPFIHSIAVIEPLAMSLAVFPVDGELPTLVGATDENRMLPILRQVAQAENQETQVESFRLDLAHYGRFNRCVLRYRLTEWADDGSLPPGRLVYGKVYGDERGEQVYQAMSAIRHYLLNPGDGYPFRVPNVLDYRPEFRMILMESLPGELLSKRLLRHRLAGKPEPEPGALTLEESLDISAQMLATLHRSGLGFQHIRCMGDELAELSQGVSWIQPFMPELASWLGERLEYIAQLADQTEELALFPSHGDYRFTQLVLSGTQAGLVDFDTVCQAEPALDLGQFLAIQRLAIDKDQDPQRPFPVSETERLCRLFVDSYLQAAMGQTGDPDQIRARTEVYELISLFRLVVHSWQKLKGSRLQAAVKVLKERIGWKRSRTAPHENKMQ